MSSTNINVSTKETTVATAAVPARGTVHSIARVETTAPEKFAAAADEKLAAARALAHKEAACAEAEAAMPAAHAKAAVTDLGDAISAKIDASKEGSALKKHTENAEIQAKRAHNETIEAKEQARSDAIKDAEAKAAKSNRSHIVSEYREGKDVVVVAEVPARGATVGTGVADSHAADHLVAASKERVLATEAAAAKADAEARLDAAHPGAEAKAAVGGIGTKIGARFHEAKEWLAEKFHDKKADSLESKAEKQLADDLEKARQKAKDAAEAEAARLDRNAKAVLTSEQTVAKVTTTSA